jgi:hypothetical protein
MMMAFSERPQTGMDSFSWGAVVVVLGVSMAHGVTQVVHAEAPHVVLNCASFEKKDTNAGVGSKGVGAFRFSTGLGFSKTSAAWEHVVHGIIARYTDLCNRFTSGLFTKMEYETGLEELDGFYREAKKLEVKLLDAVQSRRDGIHSTDIALESAVADLATRLRQAQGHEQISAPLNPGRPKKPRPILGAPGRTEELETPLLR